MRLGCSSCLTAMVGLGIAALVAGAVIGATLRMVQQPDAQPVVTTPADGSRAQQKLFELTRRRRAAAQTVTFSEPEVNALLSHHLVEARGVRLGSPSVRFREAERVEVTASLPLERILDEAPVPVASVVPKRWRERPVWLHVGARVRVEDREPRQLRLDVDDLVVGRQRVPATMLRLFLDPTIVGLLRWSLPSHIEGVTIEPGRAVIRTAS